MDTATVLPYRTGPEELAAWVEARARGRSAGQLRSAGFSAKHVEGAATTAAALGLADPAGEALTPLGERFALADPAERVRLLRGAVRQYPPYRELLRAVAQRPGNTPTETQWIETWWATRGFGSSESNRREAAATLGRLVEHLGLGRYIPGRRGHPTRIEWDPRGLAGVEALPGADPPPAAEAPPPKAFAPPPLARVPEPTRSAVPPLPFPPPPPPREGEEEVNRVTVALQQGRVARLELPSRCSAEEKRRLLELIDLLVAEE